MKKSFLFLYILMFSLVNMFFSCSKDEDGMEDKFIGKWDVVELYVNDQWVSVEDSAAGHMKGSYIQFYPERKFASWGHLGIAVGQYTLNGNLIVCYSNGMEYSRYELISLDGHYAEFNASVFDEFMKIRCILDENPDDDHGHEH